MDVLLIGPEEQTVPFADFLKLRNNGINLRFMPEYEEPDEDDESPQVIFDFLAPGYKHDFDFFYFGYKRGPVFFNGAVANTRSLKKLTTHLKVPLIGFNALHGVYNPACLEVAARYESHFTEGKTVLSALGIECIRVADRVGLAMPRLVCMIINEAFYTLQEGTATEADIDLSMKLGTNYPYGPFEWALKIGLDNVVAVLDAVYADTREERYRVCPLLRERAGEE